MQRIPLSNPYHPLAMADKTQRFWLATAVGAFLFTFNCICATGQVSAIEPAIYEAKPTDDGLIITRNEQAVAEYLAFSGAKPVFAALKGPDGEQLTRSYPVGDPLETEKKDHIHHRSMWFTHGEVNGVDFWAETPNHGKIIQTSLKTESGDGSLTLKTTNDWTDSKGQKVLSDQRLVTFHDVHGSVAVDYAVKLIASDGPVVFGDTKEGSFGIRVAGTMKVDAKLGGKIVSSQGLENGAAWGEPAEWVDYYGPVGDGVSGIAILNHPSSFGFPTRWHVRTYGLFAANPFGVHHFTGGKPTEGVRLESGESLTLKYRVLLHSGTTEEAAISAAWDEYSKATVGFDF